MEYIDLVRERLHEAWRHENMRAAFASCDCNGYGFAPLEQVLQRLPPEVELSEAERSAIMGAIDTNSDGYITYREFYEFFNSPSDAYTAGSSSTLSQMIVITRHGARFPLKQMGILWPKEKAFWTEYGGKLTPMGHAQLVDLGKQMRAHYIDALELLDPNHPDVAATPSNGWPPISIALGRSLTRPATRSIRVTTMYGRLRAS